MNLSEIVKVAEIQLSNLVPLKQIKSDILAAGHSSKTYAAIERILHSKKLVPETAWQILKQKIYDKMGLVKINPKKKSEAIFSILIFLTLMVYFIAIFRNLDKGPLHVFVNNPLKLAFHFSAPTQYEIVEVDYNLIPKLDVDLTAGDPEILAVLKILPENLQANSFKPNVFEFDPGYKLDSRIFFDATTNNSFQFLSETTSYAKRNQARFFAGTLKIGDLDRIKTANLRAQNNEKNINVLFDVNKSEDVFISSNNDAVEVSDKEIPMEPLFRKIKSILKSNYSNSEIVFEVLSDNIIQLNVADENKNISELKIKYYLFVDPITQFDQIGFEKIALESSGVFMDPYPTKKRGPRPSGISESKMIDLIIVEDVEKDLFSDDSESKKNLQLNLEKASVLDEFLEIATPVIDENENTELRVNDEILNDALALEKEPLGLLSKEEAALLFNTKNIDNQLLESESETNKTFETEDGDEIVEKNEFDSTNSESKNNSDGSD